MANEAVIVELLGNQGDVMKFTVADGGAISKGTLMKYGSDPRTSVISSSDGDLFCGIASEEKVASDGQTEIGVYTNLIADLKITAGGTSVLGGTVKIGAANQVTVADDDTVAKAREVVGTSLETGGNAEVVEVKILI